MLRSPLRAGEAVGFVFAFFESEVLGASVVCGEVLLPVRPFETWANNAEAEKEAIIITKKGLLISTVQVWIL